MYGCSYKAELLKNIDADKLPSCYGGSADFKWEDHEKAKAQPA
jgi:hypothetical protein